jgi:hypothetical protein
MSFHDLIRRKADGASKSPSAPKAPSSTPAALTGQNRAVSDDLAFDPSKHSVKGVLAYVEEHPDEAEGIYQAEASGKARSSLLSALGE